MTHHILQSNPNKRNEMGGHEPHGIFIVNNAHSHKIMFAMIFPGN